MAIPVRATITCPNCGASEDVTFADTSVGPHGRTSKTPVYSMADTPRWPKTRRDEDGKSVTYLSCASCGEAEFTTLSQLAS
ncbi:hypothetical protein RXV86_01985 [Alisedimentitalea sp. MJ-SS2]|uniref:hypothetical protein n=1 Tax=Aliisedimentitalea sp. MJ-SS2 TaxID=3049795 RepID=UPI002909DE9E|nr:hypothetical protein [Alisedimentitalea sp. MJ-SS2]MDU8926146.1 hypothetical protein [Alisedimentitalea sp. MJ-SS2]